MAEPLCGSGIEPKLGSQHPHRAAHSHQGIWHPLLSSIGAYTHTHRPGQRHRQHIHRTAEIHKWAFKLGWMAIKEDLLKSIFGFHVHLWIGTSEHTHAHALGRQDQLWIGNQPSYTVSFRQAWLHSETLSQQTNAHLWDSYIFYKPTVFRVLKHPYRLSKPPILGRKERRFEGRKQGM